jgi:hypothetical protein
MSENKTGKYLKYAIGEIVLVMIGILLALQVNTWNESRKAKLRSVEYHARIIEDLNRIVTRSNRLNQTSYDVLNSIQTTIGLLDQGKTPTIAEKETIDYALIWISRFNYQLDELATYEEMQSSGDLNLLYNTDLRDDLVNFHDYMVSVDAIFNRLGATIADNLSMFDEYVRSEVNPKTLEIINHYNFLEMSRDKEFINKFSRLAVHWRGNAFFTDQISKRAKALSESCQKELNNLQ